MLTAEFRLVIIHEGDAGNILSRVVNLRAAASELKVPTLVLDSSNCCYAGIRPLGPRDMLINAGRGSERLETLLLSDSVVTFYARNPLFVNDRQDSTIFTVIHEKMGLPMPKTIHATPRNTDHLDTYVEYLEGFPIVLKAIGGTKGIGTIVVESMRSLRSVLDSIAPTQSRFIMRQYIEPSEIARLTVLDGKVIAANQKFIPEHDFRSNVAYQAPAPKSYSKQAEEIAIQATSGLGLEFGGADILFDQYRRPYLLELNFPCDYLTSEIASGAPIGLMMVSHLLRKAYSKPLP